MKSETLLDYAVLQLSPNRSRCELIVSSDGVNEKVASGFVKPFVAHLKVVGEQVELAVQSIKLEVERRRNGETWFTKGTLERFVRFVSTPEFLELVKSLDAEMCQLEAARGMYSQVERKQLSGASCRDESGTIEAADGTKNELLRAMDGRLVAVRQDLTSACARAMAAGFNPESISDLQSFADEFGAHRLNEACRGFVSVYKRRPDLINDKSWKTTNPTVQSLNDNPTENIEEHHHFSGSHNKQAGHLFNPVQSNHATCQQPSSSSTTTTTLPTRRAQDEKEESTIENNVFGGRDVVVVEEKEDLTESSVQQTCKTLTRRLSVQDRINLFENKQKENFGGKPSELKRLSSSDVSSFSSPAAAATDTIAFAAVSEKTVLRRWSGAGEDIIDLNGDSKEVEKASVCTPPSVSQSKFGCAIFGVSVDKDDQTFNDAVNSNKTEAESIGLNDQADLQTRVDVAFIGDGEQVELNDHSISEEKFYLEQAVVNEQPEFPNQLEVIEHVGANSDSTMVSTSHKIKLEKQGRSITPKPLKKSHDRTENRKSDVTGKVSLESKETCNSISVAPSEQVHRVRRSKGNQELNDELQLKADELEKLFAEHKLRVPGDQSMSSRVSKPAHMPIEHTPNIMYQASAERASEQFFDDFPIPGPTGEGMQKSFPEVSVSDDSRGRFYDNYVEKREAKLKEEWGTKKAEKEARMKAMQDSFEYSRAELKLKLSRFTEKQDPMSNARFRTEKLRSFNVRANITREQPMDDIQCEDGDLSDLREQKPYGQERLVSGNSVTDGAAKTIQVKKLLPSRNFPSSTPRTSVTPVQRSSIKPSNSGSAGRRKAQTENHLTQSVPNFSDSKKENAKPSPAVGKTTPRMKVRSNGRSKSSNEGFISSSKEEKPRRSNFLRKSNVSIMEFKAIQLNSDGQNDLSLTEKFSKNAESKPFLRKGSGKGPGTGSTVAKFKASTASEAPKNEEESDVMAFEPEDSMNTLGEEEDEEFEVEAEDFADMETAKLSLSQESDESGSESGRAIASPSTVDPAIVAELPTEFDASDSEQDSPGESPMSWNVGMNHVFSYPHEIADLEPSVSFPMGSPATWNSRSLAQTEADDAARMRKKWSSAHNPPTVSNSSPDHSRKKMSKRFKRLLKFGRKSHGIDNVADWISVTTSEGDDDNDDGRDPANRTTDDHRKSRMGFSQGHPSEYGFNERELYTEQVQASTMNFKAREDDLSGASLKAPRSFFSLSTFRNKGSNSKLR